MAEILKTDALIFGGGVAGLWLLNRLRNEGFNAWLLEQDRLGAGQTIASQGMIHGGIKYALGGKLNKASKTIADMPAHWLDCLKGEGDVDLSGCKLLSDSYYMWPGSGIRSRINAFLGSKTLQARVSKVDRKDYPDFFRDRIPGPLYRLQDIVLDIPSLLQVLSEAHKDSIFRIDWRQAEVIHDGEGRLKGLAFSGGPVIEAQQYISCCGVGTEFLMEKFGPAFTAMQRRPLRMVMVRHEIREPVYVHCVSDKFTTTPELTITSHRNARDEPVWYLGGELAEQGAGQSEEELLNTAQGKLAELFPWCNLENAEWATLAIDRAEEKQPGNVRPDDISIASHDNLMVCWPTKLTLAPNLAAAVLDRLREEQLTPGPGTGNTPAGFLERPQIAATPWEQL